MTRINLLPWREQQRKEDERTFFIRAIGAVVLAVLVVLWVHLQMIGRIDDQNSRNAFLETEIQTLDKHITEIKSLEDEKAKLLARMKVIEQLQSQRPQVVHLFDEMVRTLPDGVYLTSMKQDNKELVLEGLAQSNARVSAFMRSLDASAWIDDPRLEVIESSDQGAGLERLSRFVLRVTQVVPGEAAPAPAGDQKPVGKKAP